MRLNRNMLLVVTLLMVAGAGCKKNKNKVKDEGPNPEKYESHQIVKPKSEADLAAAKKKFAETNGDKWTVEVDPFTGYVTAAYRKPAEGRPKAFPQAGAVKEAREFMTKNVELFGFNETLLDADRLDVAGMPGGKDKPGEWLIYLRGTSHFPHPGFDAYDLGDRLHVKLIVRADGVLKVESAPPLPDPKLPDHPEIMWDDAKISKQLGDTKTEGQPAQMVHVAKSDDQIAYRIAWRFETAEGDALWFDATTGARLDAPYFEKKNEGSETAAKDESM